MRFLDITPSVTFWVKEGMATKDGQLVAALRSHLGAYS